MGSQLWFLCAVYFLVSLCFATCNAIAQNGEDALETSLTFEYPVYSCEEQNATAVLSVVAAAQIAARPVLSLTAVLDTSGSMADGNKLRLIQGTVNYIVERLARETAAHKFGSVVFESTVSELTPLQTLTEDIVAEVQTRVNATVAAGQTNLMEGIRRGVQQQTDDTGAGNYVRAVFVFTDGKPTQGELDSDAILAEVQKLVDNADGAFVIYTFGLGENLEYDLLKGIAEIGGGVLYIISDEEDIPAAFGSALGGLLTEVALQLHYTLTAKGGALLVRSGGTAEVEGDKTELYLGDLFLEERRDIVIELHLNASCGDRGSLVVEERFKDAITFQYVSRDVVTESIERATQVPTVRTEVTPVRVQVARYEIADTLEVAATHLAAGEVETCVRTIDEAETYIAQGGFTRVPYMTSVKKDMKTVREQIEAAPEVTVESRAKLEGLIDAVKKQRTGLTDAETFETVDLTTTLAKIETSEEASKEVLQVETEFPMRVKHAVSEEIEKEDYDEIEVVLTVSAPDLRRAQPALSLTSVLDRSGSMDGKPFELLIQTQKYMIDWLLEQGSSEIALGVILFSGSVTTLQSLKNLTEIDVEDLKARLDRAFADGSTELGAALDLGVEQQIQHPNCAGSQAVFVLTDGVPTSGRDRIADDLREKLKDAIYPISVYAFGLGSFDAELLKDIAEVGQGQRYILSDETDIASSFGDAAGGLLSVAAKDVEVDIRTANASIRIVSAFPDTKIRRNRTATFNFVDMFRDETRDVLLTLHVPKDVDLPTLLEVEVSFTDVLKCERLQSDVIEIKHRKTSAKPTRRLIEAQVVQYLALAAQNCSDEAHAPIAVEQISRAIDEVAQSDIKGAYKTDLQADLIELRRTFEGVMSRDYEPEEACLQVEALKDLLETQRSKGTGESVFRIQKYYDTEAREETRTVFQETVSDVPVRPAEDIFQESFVQAPEEISSAAQEMTLELKLQPVVEPVFPKPSTVVFVVDSTKGVTDVEKDFMKAVVFSTWDSFSESLTFERSYLSIVVYDASISVAMERTQLPSVTEEMLEAVFDEMRPKGETGFMEAVSAGFEVLGQVLEQHDLILVPFFGHELDVKQSKADARIFEQLVADLDFPLTVAPIALKPNASIQYFEELPQWVQVTRAECPTCADAAFETLQPLLTSIAAKRVQIDVHPNTNITVLSIDGGIASKTGLFSISDLRFDEKKTVLIQIRVDEHLHSQILFTLSFEYYDMRSFYTWLKQSAPFVVSRVDPDILATRIAVRASTKDAIKKIREAIHSADYIEALWLTSRQIAVIIRTESEDEVVEEIREKLESIMQKIHRVIDGDGDDSEVLKRIRYLWRFIDVYAYVVYPTDSEELPGEIEEPVLSIPPAEDPELTLEISSPGVASVEAENATVDVSIEAPLASGQLVDAQTTLIVDSTATADVAKAVKMADNLLTLLAGRRGRRGVEVLVWNNTLASVYKSRDFSQAKLAAARSALEGITPIGDLHYAVVLREGIDHALKQKATLSALFWIVTSKIEGEDTETLLASAQSLLTEGASSLMVFTFGAGLNPQTHSVLEEISRLSGGTAFRLVPMDVSAQERESRFRDSARAAVLWLETTFAKNVVLRFQPLSGDIIDVTVYSGETSVATQEDTVNLTTLRYGETTRIVITLQLQPKPTAASRTLKVSSGVTPLVEISTSYTEPSTGQNIELKPDTVSVESVEQKTFDRKVLLEDLLQRVDEETVGELGENNVEDALVSTTQGKVLASNSGIRHRPEASKEIKRYAHIERELERYDKERQRYRALQDAAESLGELDPSQPVLSPSIELHVNHTPISALESAVDYHPVIAVETPLLEPPEISAPRRLTVVAVFDAAEYTSRIDSELSVLSVQTQAVRTVVKRLVSQQGFDIELVAISSRYDNTTVLTPLRIDPDSLSEVDRYLGYINATGQPTDLYSSLKRGLYELESVTDSSERVVLLCSAAPSVCLVEEPRYDALLAPYITHPVNPVKVMTYIVGSTEPSRTDPVSDLTGGSRYYVETLDETDAAVEASLEQFKDVLLRGLRLTLTPASWLRSAIDVVNNGRRIESFSNLTIALADMKPSASQSVELSLELDAWTGNADLFDYSLSYFDPSRSRWYTTSLNTLRLQRAPEEVIQDRERLESVTVDALNGALLALTEERLEDSAELMHEALLQLDQSPYQDDTLIQDFTLYSSKVYDHILQLLRTEDPDIEPLIFDLLDNGAEPVLSNENPAVENQSSDSVQADFHALSIFIIVVSLFLY